MGIGNRTQAFLLGLSAFLMSLGMATATIPDIVPAEIKIPISVFFWACGTIGFALKEALGSAYEEEEET